MSRVCVIVLDMVMNVG